MAGGGGIDIRSLEISPQQVIVCVFDRTSLLGHFKESHSEAETISKFFPSHL